MAEYPSFNLPQVFKQRDRLINKVFERYEGLTVDGGVVQSIVTRLAWCLPAGISRDVLFETVRYLAGREMTDVESARLAWRIAGNIRLLKSGTPVSPWVVQTRDEWVPLLCLQALPGRNRRNNIGTNFTFRILAGTACPVKTSVFWKSGLTRAISRRMGFSAPWGEYPFARPSELVGLRLLGHVEAARSRGSPVFFRVECSSSMQKWNRDAVLKRRFRKEPCPHNYSHHCHQCVVGFTECSAGTHRYTYEIDQCDGCGTAEALFDPELNSPHCVQCVTKELLRRRE